MPQIDLSNINLAAENRKGSQTIEGSYVDLTGREDLDEDTLRLASEPEFTQDDARDREPEAALPVALPHGPLRKLNVAQINSKWQLMQQLTNAIPMNEYGQPEFIYRADILDWHSFKEALTRYHSSNGSTTTVASDPLSGDLKTPRDLTDELTAALVPLTYYEGFPVCAGKPFWDKLIYEDETAFDAFKAYLTMGAKRTIHDLIAYDMDSVNEWFHMNYWPWRVRAFELYRVAYAQKLRLERMLQTEDDHYEKASKLFASVTRVLGSFNAEELKDVGFSQLVAAMEKLVKIQRISAGLNVNGGSIEENATKSVPTTQVIMQQIVSATPQQEVAKDEQYNLLEEDPQALEKAQELLLLVGSQQDLSK